MTTPVGTAISLEGTLPPPGAGASVSLLRRVSGVLEDVLLVLLIVLLVPVGILLIGAPIALVVLTIVELARRL